MKKVILAIVLACVLSIMFSTTVLAAPPDEIDVDTDPETTPSMTTQVKGPPSYIVVWLPDQSSVQYLTRTISPRYQTPAD